ncbi:MAG TPA: hypothetical protein VI583_08940 [Cyclobacteriaceae bacterium]|nr:hypothetical protein [Cyclobacteriaceae bacterium]
MEYINGFIIPMIQFYGIVTSPSIISYSDALHIWQNRFQLRSIKAILSLVASIQKHFESHNHDLVQFNTDKNFQRIYLADYIRRLYSKIEGFKNIGIDKDLCRRVKFELIYIPSNINNNFKKFIEDFTNKDNCLNCGFLKFWHKNSSAFKKIISSNLIKEVDIPFDGFSSLKEKVILLEMNIDKLSCLKCVEIGDIIISIECPKGFQLEHTDYAFEYITKIIPFKHRRLLSESQIFKDSP